jgi:hypothetical protein
MGTDICTTHRLYFCTLGLCGIGFLLDFCALPAIVEIHNANLMGDEESMLEVMSLKSNIFKRQ